MRLLTSVVGLHITGVLCVLKNIFIYNLKKIIITEAEMFMAGIIPLLEKRLREVQFNCPTQWKLVIDEVPPHTTALSP